MLPTILADAMTPAETANGVSLIAVAMCAVNGIFLWLGQREKNRSERDRLQNDVKVARLEDKIELLTDKHRQCEDDHKQAREDMAQDRAEIADLRRRLDEASAQHRPLDRRRRDPEKNPPHPE